jgi:hypothetical protein
MVLLPYLTIVLFVATLTMLLAHCLNSLRYTVKESSQQKQSKKMILHSLTNIGLLSPLY